MVVPANMLATQELRTADGQVFAVVVSPDEFARMQAEVQALRDEAGRLRARVNEMVRTWLPAPMTADEVAAAERNAGNLSAFIANLEGK